MPVVVPLTSNLSEHHRWQQRFNIPLPTGTNSNQSSLCKCNTRSHLNNLMNTCTPWILEFFFVPEPISWEDGRSYTSGKPPILVDRFWSYKHYELCHHSKFSMLAILEIVLNEARTFDRCCFDSWCVRKWMQTCSPSSTFASALHIPTACVVCQTKSTKRPPFCSC